MATPTRKTRTADVTVVTTPAPVLEAPPAEEPTVVQETHTLSEGELIKLRAEVQDILDMIETLSSKLENAEVEIGEEKAQATAENHLRMALNALEDMHKKGNSLGNRFGFIGKLMEQAKNRAKAALAKAEKAKVAEAAKAEKAKAAEAAKAAKAGK